MVCGTIVPVRALLGIDFVMFRIVAAALGNVSPVKKKVHPPKSVGWDLVSGVATGERSDVGWCTSCLDGVLLSCVRSQVAAGTTSDVLLPPNS